MPERRKSSRALGQEARAAVGAAALPAVPAAAGLAAAIYATAAPAVAGAVTAAALLPLLTELRLGQRFPPFLATHNILIEGL